MARRRYRGRSGRGYPSVSEEMMTLTSIVASIDAVAQNLRAEKRDKEEFREKLILSDRDMRWRSDEAQKNRDAQVLRDSFQYGFGKLSEIEASIEKLDEEIASTGATQEQWESLDYINQTDGFQEYTKSVKNRQEEEGFDSLNAFAATKDNMEAITQEFSDLSTELKYKKFLMSKITGFATELGTGLPQLYEQYRDKTTGGKFQTDYDRLVDQFTLDEKEQNLLFEGLAENEMFSDIKNDKVLQMLVKRQIAPLYDVSIAKYKEGMSALGGEQAYKNAIAAREQGDVESEYNWLLKGMESTSLGMRERFSVPTYPKGDKGTKQLQKNIEKLSNELQTVPGFPEVWADNISQVMASPPDEQFQVFGKLISDALSNMDDKPGTPQAKMSKQTIDALIRSGVLGNMVDEDRVRDFITQYNMYTVYKDRQQRLLKEHTGLQALNPNVDAALNALSEDDKVSFDPKGTDYDYERAKELGYEEDDEGHLPSIDSETNMVLKGRKHPTWDKMVEVENKRGYEIMLGQDGRYYSVQQDAEYWDTYDGSHSYHSTPDSLEYYDSSNVSFLNIENTLSDSLSLELDSDSLSIESLTDSLNFLETDSTANDSISLTQGDSLVAGSGDSTELSNMFDNISLAGDSTMPESMVGYEFIGYSRGRASDGYTEGTPIFRDSSGELHGGVPKELYETIDPYSEEGGEIRSYVSGLSESFSDADEYMDTVEELSELIEKRERFRNTYKRSYDDGKPTKKYTSAREREFNLQEQELMELISQLESENPQLKEIKFASE